MSKTTTADFQKGMFIVFRGEPNQISEYTFVNPGKGSAFVRTKLKNIKSGRVLEFTFKSGEEVEEYPVNVREMQYLYKEVDKFVLMDNQSYEQLAVPESLIGNFSKFMKVGNIYQVYIHEGEALGIRYPQKIRLLVTEADEAVKGNTVSGAKKMVTLETGVSLAVPLFINKGDTIAIDVETLEYSQRVSQ